MKRKGIVTLGFLAALSGCGGVAGGLDQAEPGFFKFEAKVAVTPLQPVPNRRVSFNLEVTSASNRSVKADLLLKVVSDSGETLYRSEWKEVLFHEGEVWNLTQGFLPDPDASKKLWKVTLLVREHATGEVLYDQPIGNLEFAGSTPNDIP